MSSAVQQVRHSNGQWVLVPDDKLSNKAWLVRTLEVFAFLVSSLLADPAFVFCPTISKDAALLFLVAKGFWGLPAWLRRVGSKRQWELPTLVPLIKSKCWGDDGTHTCRKPQHSCMRRVIASGKVPWAASYRVVARAIRGVVRLVNTSREVFSLHLIRAALDGAMNSLTIPLAAECHACGCPLEHITCISCDVDQAFEQCAMDLVMPRWLHFASRFKDKFGTNKVLVRRGKRDFVQPEQRRRAGRGWFRLSLDAVTVALHSYGAMNFVCVAGIVFQVVGLPIGGVVSTAALAVFLGYLETTWYDRVGFPPRCVSALQCNACVTWLRYVDDILGFSTMYCGHCLYNYLCRGYAPLQLSLCAGIPGLPTEVVWADVELLPQGCSLRVRCKNTSREWLLHDSNGVSSSFQVWAGVSPVPLHVIRGVVWGHLHRAMALGLPSSLCAHRALEDLLELYKLGYPKKFLRGIVHSLPCVPPSLLVRKVAIMWFRSL
eukprot:1477735-Amphidinium_carterae.2